MSPYHRMANGPILKITGSIWGNWKHFVNGLLKSNK